MFGMLATALLLQSAPAATEPVPTTDEIVVIARRFDALSVGIGRDAKGRYFCNLSDTSGSRALDARLCKATAQCVRKGATGDGAVKACIAKQKRSVLADFRKAWARSRR